MRVLASLGACFLAAATANRVSLDRAPVAQDYTTKDSTPTVFHYDPNANETATAMSLLETSVLSAYGDYGYGYEDDEDDSDDDDDDSSSPSTPQCAAGPVDVLILVSSCFTPAEITKMLNPIDTAMTDGTMTFYHNDQKIAVRPSFGIYYYDCQTTLNVPHFPNVPQIYYPTHRNLFVAISKGTESSFSKVFTWTGVKMAYTLQIRTCTNLRCAVGRNDLVVSSPAVVSGSITKIRDVMFCPTATNPPTLYSDAQNKRQCACGCPAPLSINHGVCKCPGDQNLVNNACKCPASGQSLVNDVCTCPGDLVPRNGLCQCPVEQVRNGNSNQCKCPGQLQRQSDGTCKPAPTTPPTTAVPTQPPVQVTTQPPTQPPVQVTTQPPTEATPTEGPTQGTPTDGPTEGPTHETPTDGPTEGPTQGTPTDGPTEGPTQGPDHPVETNRPADCVGGRVQQPDGSCVCPPDQEVGVDNVCVEKCFWKPGNAAYKCAWSNQAKTSLTLNGDCSVEAPVASDVYVDDMRTNEYDSNLRLQDPLIELGSTPRGTSTRSTHQTTWRNYETTPSLLEDSVTFDAFGVYDLSMVATNYRKRAACYSCIAIVDDFQPTAVEPCKSAGSVSADYSSDNLGTTINAEAAFKSFYADNNVVDNGEVDVSTGANVRDDIKSAQVKDFFATGYSDANFDTDCFSSNFVTDLLSKMTSELDPNEPLECKRCCQKSTTLRGTYKDHSCSSAAGTPKYFPVRAEDQCSFDRCISMKSPDLADAFSSITDAANSKSQKILNGLQETVTLDSSTIHRSIPCTTFNTDDASCRFSAKLGDLFTHSASWQAGLDIPSTYSADDYVHWFYYVGVGSVNVWNGNDDVVFTEKSTDVVVRAYTHCGLVKEFTYRVVLHPHSNHDACVEFDSKWLFTSPPATYTVTPASPSDKPAVCAYPGSDFAALEFIYNIDDVLTHGADSVQGSYTNVQCYVTVAPDHQIHDVAEMQIPLSSWSPGSKIVVDEQFAVELVHDPTTVENTDVQVRCDFTFQHYDETTTATESCLHKFSITSCDVPTLEPRGDEVCTQGKCADPVGAPGPFEACNGAVFTLASGSTTLKPVSNTCCDQCSSQLDCVELPESSEIKRCEPAMQISLVTLAAKQLGDVNSSMTAVFGATAMVAIIAIVAIKRRTAAANRLRAYDDAYHPLLE